MRVSVFVGLILFWWGAGPLYAAQQAVGDDGRQVQLSDDGSWVYSSTDRFATTTDGKRVRLKQDGSWVYTGETSIDNNTTATAGRVYIDEQSLEVVLSDLVIESMRGKKSAAHKNSRKKTQSVFYLTISLEKEAAKAFTLSIQHDDLVVEDTDGREYPVTSVKPALVTVEPGKEVSLVVRADGAPHWWTTKSMRLTLDKTLFSGRKNTVLAHALSHAKKKKVERFE